MREPRSSEERESKKGRPEERRAREAPRDQKTPWNEGTSRRGWLRGIGASFGALALGAEGSGCAPVVEDGRTVVSLWFAYGGKNREELLSLVNRFNASQGAVRVVATYQGEYFEALAKLRTALAAKVPPALTHVIGEVVPYLAEAGVLESLDRFGARETLDLVPVLAQEGAFLRGGERPLVGLPFNRSTPIAYFNRAVLDELKLAPPRTWEELRAFAKAAMVRGNDGSVARWGFVCPIDWWFWAALVGQAGGDVIEADGSVTLGGEAGVRALRLWQTMVHEDGTMKPPPGRDYNAWQAASGDFLAGRAAMIWTSTAFLRDLETKARFEVVTAALPRDVRAAVPIGGTLFVMPKGNGAKVQEAAYRFLAWMMEPEQANQWATRTGYMPVSRRGLEVLRAAGYYREHPNDAVAVEQLAVARPWPWSAQLFRVQREAVQPRLEEAVLAKRDAVSVLDEARRAAAEP